MGSIVEIASDVGLRYPPVGDEKYFGLGGTTSMSRESLSGFAYEGDNGGVYLRK